MSFNIGKFVSAVAHTAVAGPEAILRAVQGEARAVAHHDIKGFVLAPGEAIVHEGKALRKHYRDAFEPSFAEKLRAHHLKKQAEPTIVAPGPFAPPGASQVAKAVAEASKGPVKDPTLQTLEQVSQGPRPQ